jgi:hypothetical protein
MPDLARRTLRKQRGKMLDYFGRDVIVRNFTEGAVDDYGDSDRVLDAEITVQGMVTQPSDPAEVSTPYGQTTTIDAEIFVPDETLVTDGSDLRPYPTEIRDPVNGTTYTAVEVFDENNGWLRVDAVSTGYEGD